MYQYTVYFLLENDGRGTDVLKELAFASYLILPDRLSPEEERQQEVILAPVVLGEQSDEKPSTESTQMIFYEENKILGADIDLGVKKDTGFSLRKVGNFFLSSLETIDRFILFSSAFPFFLKID